MPGGTTAPGVDTASYGAYPLDNVEPCRYSASVAVAVRKAWKVGDMAKLTGEGPAYQQVADELRRDIKAGVYQPSADLPSNPALMERFGVSTNTIQKALRILKAEGLVASNKGKSVYVRQVSRQISRSADYTVPVADGERAPYRLPSDQLTIAREVPPDDVAEALGLDAEEEAIRRGRVMLGEDGKVEEIVISWIPDSVASGTDLERPGRLKGGMPAALQRLGFPSRAVREWVDARMPTPDEARVLRLPEGTPVFRLLRITRSDNDRAVEALEMVLGGDRYRLEYDLPVS